MQKIELEIIDDLSAIDMSDWNRLTKGNPFLNYTFLDALHKTECASKQTGWLPQYLVIRSNVSLLGAMPMYLKTHSQGEYVFDYSWANAYEHHGVRYYPKLVCAIPFTAVTGPRLLADSSEIKVLLAQGAKEFAKRLEVSSIHVLFPEEDDVEVFKEQGYLIREGVQFHWKNAGYNDFEAFLASMNREKRKKIKQDRRHVVEAGVVYRRLRGIEISDKDLDFFYLCYSATYRNHYSSPYLTREFFQLIHELMPDSMLLIVGDIEGKPVAAALNFIGGGVMYGRYWGTRHFISGLHFETCYMQSIEYCIAHEIATFEGGAQGEHKLSRGLLPTSTKSAHWIANQRFANAIKDFLEAETQGINHYIEELEGHTPFKVGTI